MAMNERIRELMEEAGIYDFVVESMGINEEMEKFAELIVAECLVTLDSIVCDTSGERDTLWVARKVVADHFGVEE
jgi:predicted transposase YbfD/YdcC